MKGKIVRREDILKVVKNKTAPTCGSRIAGRGGILREKNKDVVFVSQNKVTYMVEVKVKPRKAKPINHHFHIPISSMGMLKKVVNASSNK